MNPLTIIRTGLRCLRYASCLLAITFLFWLAPVSAQTLFGIQPPPPENPETLTLSSGDTVTFRSRNQIGFQASGEIGVFLIYETDDIPSEMSDISVVENRLFANTQEICRGPAQQHVDFILDQSPELDFTVLAVMLRKVVGEKNGLKQFLNWTGVYRLSDGKCGEPIYKPNSAAN